MTTLQAAVAGLYLGAVPAPGTWNWNLFELEGRDYVSVDQVAEFYRLPQPARSGDSVKLGTGDKGVELWVSRKEAVVNGVRFSLCFPVTEHRGQPMLSRKDLVKVFEPLMRPERIPFGKAFKTVVIDAGHGGGDRGARSRWSTEEAQLTLSVAKRLRPLLEAAGFKVVMTRIRDEFKELADRAAVAENYENSIFVSLHFNSGDSAARGVETYALAPAGSPSTASERLRMSDFQSFAGNANDGNNVLLAAAVHRRMSQLWGNAKLDRGVKRARFVVLYQCKRPSILIEGGFVSNPEDGKLISNPDFQLRMAEHIKLGILDYQSLLNEGVQYEPGMMIVMNREAEAVEVPMVETSPTAMIPRGGLPITTVAIGTNILDVTPFRPVDF
ncbi:MAG TPA: N-acetylmuramoyl-L-alanine amidase [Verrucomicrobiae bacterium]|nr:N-acetylmuramoyl-L-alanine amidase [Verrucomicrobiae bacterium]